MSALANLKSDDKTYVGHSFDVIQHVYHFESDRQAIENYIIDHGLEDFLIWIHAPIEKVFGNVEKQLNLFQCWDEDEPRLILTICSNMKDLDEIMELESQLFVKLDSYPDLLDTISRVTIKQN